MPPIRFSPTELLFPSWRLNLIVTMMKITVRCDLEGVSQLGRALADRLAEDETDS
jgi:hypothetical protein